MKENWTYKKLGEVCDVKTGKLDANASDEDGLYPFFTCSKEPLRINTYSYDAECVLVAGNGDLNVKYYNGKFDAYQRTYIITLKNGITDISVRYLYCFFLLYVETLRKKSIGGVIKYIKLGDITEAKVHIPSLSEQHRIVSELDLLQSIIDKQQAQLKELDKLAQAVFYDMFGDPVENEKGWETTLLSNACSSISDGSHNPPKGGEESTFLMLSSKNIKDGTLTFDEPRYLTKEEFDAENKRTNVQTGDVLLTIVGTIGRCCLFNSTMNVVFQRSVAVLKPKSIINNVFLMYQMIMLRSFLENEAKGVAQKGIYLKQLGKITVITPSLSLQQSFAEKIEAIEKQKDAISQSIAETQKLFDYTMDKYFG